MPLPPICRPGRCPAWRHRLWVLSVVAGMGGNLAAVAPVRAETDYFAADGPKEGITFRAAGHRTSGQWQMIAGLGGASVVAGAIGLYFNLDAQSASNGVATSVETIGKGRTYTQDLEDQRRRAVRSSYLAGGAYAIGGAFLISTVVAFIVSHPGTHEVTLRSGAPTAALIPVDGGAIAQTGWSF